MNLFRSLEDGIMIHFGREWIVYRLVSKVRLGLDILLLLSSMHRYKREMRLSMIIGFLGRMRRC